VSGHRDLHAEEIAPLRGAVTEFLHQFRYRLAHTQVRIMVGMAEGADLLVAQTALELGLQVDAILPMPLEQYASDFGDESFRLLTQLLTHPNLRRVELPVPPPVVGSSDHAWRDALYANLALVLMRESSLLLALWDGQPSPLIGGTADTVLRYLGVRTEDNKNEAVISVADAPGEMEATSRLVYWISASRSASTPATAEVSACYLCGVSDNAVHKQASMPAQLAHQLKELDDYNREYEQLRGRLLAPDSLLRNLPVDVPVHDRAALQAIDEQYGKADSLAVYFQKRSDTLFKVFSSMAVLMGVSYLVYEKFVPSHLILFGYVVILLFGIGVYHFLHDRRWFAKHLIYRVLAETMRVKFYLRLAGADQLVDAHEVLSLAGVDRFRGFAWIGHALRSAELNSHVRGGGAAPGPGASRYVDDAWIRNQEGYFASKVAKLAHSSRRISLARTGLFAVILSLIVALIAFGDFLHHAEAGFGIHLHNVFTFLIGLIAVLLGIWELHQNKMATRELLWQYRNQLGHFARASSQLSSSTSWGRRLQLLSALGRESLMESYLWTIHRYHREHEPPTSG
jgi:hypothetical protein